MSINVYENITDDVCGSVWFAALILTYEAIELTKVKGVVLLKQTEIQYLAKRICVKDVQSARISQWCNGDHLNNNYNYLRAVNEERRLTRIGEFNGVKEYPPRLLDSDTQVFTAEDNDQIITYGLLFRWYSEVYSKNIHLNEIIRATMEQELIIQDYVGINELQEDDVKEKLNRYLTSLGWTTHIAMGKIRGIDIDAYKGTERWVIEVKGCGSRSAMRVNYFLSMLGEILQRMDDPNAKYSIALPNMKQYRVLWGRLPKLAKERTNITILFVSEDGAIEEGY
ncbi:hypothetical protein NSQ55_03585 [Paenibacillus sp. FSL H7-0943]|uniref:hypothetical protein n=1 Tax=Paenibacillus sp. FSL H7-0943 TaxID=2954739 RepID=UPI0030D4AA78